MSLCYDFHLHVAVSSSPCSFNAYTSGDNGNVFQIVNNVDSSRSTAFTYDALNRISQGSTINTNSTSCWGETYTIDAWGNLTNRAGVSGMGGGCTTEGLNATATTKNQLSGVGILYDASGNVTNDGNGNTPTYDAANEIASVAGVTYSYDAAGMRMEKSSGTKYWFGPGGEVLTETDLSGIINEEYIYFNGARIARVDRPSGTVHYYFSDYLGTASVITNASGTSPAANYYYPYGGSQSSTGSDPNHYKFTGKERDAESGLDDFLARYYSSASGRFMIPDWSAGEDPVPYAQLTSPQTLNLYGYVMNNPVSKTDPTGHWSASMANIYSGDFHCEVGHGSCQSDIDSQFWGDGPGGEACTYCSEIPTDILIDQAINRDTLRAPLCVCGDPPQNQNQPATPDQNQPQQASAPAIPMPAPAPLVWPALGEIAGKVLTKAALPLLILDYLISPNQGKVAIDSTDQLPPRSPMAAKEHTKGARPSTAGKHEEGTARKRKDRGGEKGDARRRPPRKPPDNWKGPWPPKEGQNWD